MNLTPFPKSSPPLSPKPGDWVRLKGKVVVFFEDHLTLAQAKFQDWAVVQVTRVRVAGADRRVFWRLDPWGLACWTYMNQTELLTPTEVLAQAAS